jgi:hypothetical protein
LLCSVVKDLRFWISETNKKQNVGTKKVCAVSTLLECDAASLYVFCPCFEANVRS